MILLGALLFGVMPSAAKFAYRDGANALSVILGRSVIGVVVLLLFIGVTGRTTGISARNMRRSFLAGIAHVFAAIGVLASIVYIDISLASIILFLYPFPIAIYAHWRGETRLTLTTVALMVLATLGLAMVLGTDWVDTDPRGIAIAAMGAVAFSVMILAMVELGKTVGAPRSNLLMTKWAVLIFGLVAIAGPVHRSGGCTCAAKFAIRMVRACRRRHHLFAGIPVLFYQREHHRRSARIGPEYFRAGDDYPVRGRAGRRNTQPGSMDRRGAGDRQPADDRTNPSSMRPVWDQGSSRTAPWLAFATSEA